MHRITKEQTSANTIHFTMLNKLAMLLEFWAGLLLAWLTGQSFSSLFPFFLWKKLTRATCCNWKLFASGAPTFQCFTRHVKHYSFQRFQRTHIFTILHIPKIYNRIDLIGMSREIRVRFFLYQQEIRISSSSQHSPPKLNIRFYLYPSIRFRISC